MDPLASLISTDNLVSVLRDILAQLKKQGDRVTVLEKTVEIRDREVKELKEHMAAANANITSLTRNNEVLKQRLDELEARLQEQLNDIRTQISAINNRLSILTGEGRDASKLGDRMRDLEALASKTSDGLRTVVSDLSSLTGRVTAVETGKADRTELARTQSMVAEHTEQLKALESQIRKILDNMARMEATLRTHSDKLGVLLHVSVCERCEEKKPTWACAQCGKNYCDACDKAVHSADGMQGHIRTPLTGKESKVIEIARVPSSSMVGDGVSRAWVDEKVAELMRKDRELASLIADLTSRLSGIASKVDELSRNDSQHTRDLTDLLNRLNGIAGGLGGGGSRELKGNDGANGDFATRAYVDQQYGDLLGRLQALQKAIDKALKVELKRFERDIMVFLEDRAAHMDAHGGNHTEAAMGKIHFRCVSCDQPVASQHGPSTPAFQQAVRAIPIDTAASTMAIQRGDELSLYGKDGQVYKGRGNTTTVFAPGDPGKSSTFNVIYSDKNPGNRPAHGPPYATPYTVPRPYSAGPARSGGNGSGLGGTYQQSLSTSTSGGGTGGGTARASRVQSFGSSVRPRTASQSASSPNRAPSSVASNGAVIHHSHPIAAAPYYSPSPPPQPIASYATTEFKEPLLSSTTTSVMSQKSAAGIPTSSSDFSSQPSSIATTPSTPFVTSAASSLVGAPTPRGSTPTTSSGGSVPSAWDNNNNNGGNASLSTTASTPSAPMTPIDASNLVAGGRKSATAGKRSSSRTGQRDAVAFR